nr:tigger transposable element-derived protein 6-like [Parasteatoda tepidariorum]
MKRKKKKIALLVDNCTPHNNPPSLKNIKLFYFPPNCTSSLLPLDLGIIKCFKGYYRTTRLIQNVVYNLDNKLPNPYAVDVKNACDWISGGWNSLAQSTIQNCWKKASFFEEKNNGNAETELTEITDEEEKCLAGLNSIVSDFQRSSNTSFLFNADEFFNLDNDVLVFSGASDEEILAEVIPEILAEVIPGDQSDEEEAADYSQNRTQISPENAILLINTLQDFVATFPNVTDVHLNSLDGLKSMSMEMAIASKNNQTKLTDYFSK